MGGVFKQGTADEVAVQEDINTRERSGANHPLCLRILRAPQKAGRYHARRVLMCDKSNAMTHAGGLWQRVFKEVQREYPQIKPEHMYVDALCMQMVRDPRQFDVIVTNNMFGDIITDLAAGLQGGLGMAASGNIHPGKTSMFEPVHGSAPPIAGKNIANPMGAILTARDDAGALGCRVKRRALRRRCLKRCGRKNHDGYWRDAGDKEAAEWVPGAVASR